MDPRSINTGSENRWRLVSSGRLDAYSNMAIDETILESYLNQGGLPTLRIYGWDPEAVSIGFAEKMPLDLIDECEKRDIDIVRRPTGGGSLLHSGDISYSVVCSTEDIGCGKSVVESFKRICRFLLEMYRTLGIDARFACELADHPVRYKIPSRAKTNICMASHEKYDIVVGDRKLGGNAQKRRRNAILQHGSIPLVAAQSPFFVEGPISLSEACGREVSFEEVQKQLIESFAKTFEVDPEESILSGAEREIFRKLLRDKYTTRNWNDAGINDRKKAVMA